MDSNANRSRGRRPRADTYWLRRFFTLLAGLGVVGLLAWACSGVASGGNSASSSGRRSSAAQKAAGRPAACPATGLVLTLTASQASYGSAATPAFQVDIVSTGTATCTLDTGPAALRRVVLHGGSVAYNSATCLHGARKHVVSLRRGVPVITSMTWNKHETAPGCPTTVVADTNRTYTAVAQAGGARSPGSSFRLTGSPATARAAAPAARSW